MPRIISVCLVTGLFSCAGSQAHLVSKTHRVPIAKNTEDVCVHGVPCETCVKCHPKLATLFEEAGDWCPEHQLPESQDPICHPELIRLPSPPPAGVDYVQLVKEGEDLATLESKTVRGKITVFDFYADWCGPCRKVDDHVFDLLRNRADVAYRKLNIVSWESPIAKRYLVGAKVPNLPYVIVFDKDGKRHSAVAGLDLKALDQAIAGASGGKR